MLLMSLITSRLLRSLKHSWTRMIPKKVKRLKGVLTKEAADMEIILSDIRPYLIRGRSITTLTR